MPERDTEAAAAAAAVSPAYAAALTGARQAKRLSEVAVAQLVLASFDAMVVQEEAEGGTVREGGTAWRGFVTHLGMVLDESRNRAATILSAAIGIRALPVAYGIFQTGAYGWQAVEAVVRHAGSLTGDARDQYDAEAARLAADLVPQLLDAALSRLHDSLDHTAATEQGARAIRMRGVRARPGEHGTAELILRGPEFDIAAIYETAHRLAVAAHGVDGETRTVQQLMYDILCDLILGGMRVPAGPDPDAAHAPTAEPASASSPDTDDDVAEDDADVPVNHDWLPTDPPAGRGGSASDDDDDVIDLLPDRGAPPGGRPPGGLLPASGVDPPPGPDSPFWIGRHMPPNINLHPDGSFTPGEPHDRIGDPRVPHRKVISAEIVVTVPAATAAGAADAPGKLAGWGSLPGAEVRRLVTAARYWTRIETDPIDDAIIGFDSQQRTIPAALRRLIQARSGTCDEPGCPTPAHRAEIDHVIRVEHGGRTMQINLSALCRPSHQTKDDGYLHVTRTPDGLRWASKWGATRLKKNQMPVRARTTPAAADGEAVGEDTPPF